MFSLTINHLDPREASPPSRSHCILTPPGFLQFPRIRARIAWDHVDSSINCLKKQAHPSRPVGSPAFISAVATPINTGIAVITASRVWSSSCLAGSPYLQTQCFTHLLRLSLTASATVSNPIAIFYSKSTAVSGELLEWSLLTRSLLRPTLIILDSTVWFVFLILVLNWIPFNSS